MTEEFDTTIRIIELVTRSGVFMIRLSKDCTVHAFKKLQDIYHAGILSRAGQMTYETLIKHVGRDTVILDFHVEKAEELEELKRGLTQYKVSFVQLPDMEIGDGRTQFMIDASDAAKVNGYLKAHINVKMDPMTANEYTSMGTKKQWDEIHKKACEQLKVNPVGKQQMSEENSLKESRREEKLIKASEEKVISEASTKGMEIPVKKIKIR